jgi:hypothetical protein
MITLKRNYDRYFTYYLKTGRTIISLNTLRNCRWLVPRHDKEKFFNIALYNSMSII